MSKEILTITPVYNNANLLNEMLCSLVCQSYKNFDILIVDDSSSEDLSSTIKSFKDTLNIKTLRQKTRQGPSAARQAGLEYAYKKKYKYVIFLDSDDLLLPNAIKRLYYSIDSIQADLVYSSIITEQKDMALPDSYMNIYMGSTWLHGKIFKLDFLKMNNIHFFKELMIHEDLAFNIITRSAPGALFSSIEDKLYYYRENQNSMTHKDNDSSITYLQALYKAILFILNNNFNLLEEVIISLLISYNEYQLLYLKDSNSLTEIDNILNIIFNNEQVQLALKNYNIWQSIRSDIYSFILTSNDYNENKDWNLLSFYKETFGQWLQKYGIQINNICTNEMSNPNSNNKMRISDLLF